jgi:CRP-like cAMP-binding protein
MLAQAEILDLLRANPLFAAFDDALFSRVTAGAQLLHLEAGQILFQQGDPAQAFFVVASGQVKLFLQSRAGVEQIVELDHPGQSFAEAIMFMRGRAYPVSAAATEATTVVSIPMREYLEALRRDAETCLRMLGDLSQRLHAKIRDIEELTLENAGTRLIRHLLRRAAPDPAGRLRVHFDETRQMLASQLAIKPETLSRLTRSLSDAGLIELDGRDIVIADAERLQQHYLS